MPRKKKIATPALDDASAVSPPTAAEPADAAPRPLQGSAIEATPRPVQQPLLETVTAQLQVPPDEVIVEYWASLDGGPEGEMYEGDLVYVDRRLAAAVDRLATRTVRYDNWNDIFDRLYEQPDRCYEYFPKVDLTDEAELIVLNIGRVHDGIDDHSHGFVMVLHEAFGLQSYGEPRCPDKRWSLGYSDDDGNIDPRAIGCSTMHRDEFEKVLAAVEEIIVEADPRRWAVTEIYEIYSGDMSTLRWRDSNFDEWSSSFASIHEHVRNGGPDAIEYEQALRRHLAARGIGEHANTLLKGADEEDSWLDAFNCVLQIGGFGSSGGGCGMGWSHSVATIDDENYGRAVDLCSKIAEAAEAAEIEVNTREAIREALEAIASADTAAGGGAAEAAEALLRSRKATSKAWRTGRWLTWLPESPIPGTESWAAARIVLLAAALAEQRGEAVNLEDLDRVTSDLRASLPSGR